MDRYNGFYARGDDWNGYAHFVSMAPIDGFDYHMYHLPAGRWQLGAGDEEFMADLSQGEDGSWTQAHDG